MRGHQGKALLELALLLPFLAVVVLGALELFKSFHNFQYMSVVVREIGNSVYRDCVTLDNDGTPAGTTRTSDCVAQLVNRVTNFNTSTAGVLPGAIIIVRVYRVAAAPILAGGFNVNGSGGKTTRYSDAVVSGLHSYTPQKGTIVTTEVFFDSASFSSYFTGELYETTIF